jgi:hypothetical protein
LVLYKEKRFIYFTVSKAKIPNSRALVLMSSPQVNHHWDGTTRLAVNAGGRDPIVRQEASEHNNLLSSSTSSQTAVPQRTPHWALLLKVPPPFKVSTLRAKLLTRELLGNSLRSYPNPSCIQPLLTISTCRPVYGRNS